MCRSDNLRITGHINFLQLVLYDLRINEELKTVMIYDVGSGSQNSYKEPK